MLRFNWVLICNFDKELKEIVKFHKENLYGNL